MKRVLVISVFLCSLAGCSTQPTPTQTEAANAQPAATPSASPSAMAVAPSLAMPSPGSSAAPPLVPPVGPAGKDGKAKSDQKALPPDIWERMTRPLTLEEINKLPPETRDMILRAQGRLPGSPSPSPAKKK